MKTTRIVTAAGLAAVLLAACGTTQKKAAPPPPTSSTTRPAPTTTTLPPVYPLTGLPAKSRTQMASPAVVVKIDNIDQARPQTGINQADVVYEELVEGGLTRLAAVFQSSYPSVVGPVRSGRLTDEGIIDDLNHPVFTYAGTNGVFLPILESQPVTTATPDNQGGLFWRDNSRAAPHNLYSDVASLARLDHPSDAPRPLFEFLKPGEAFTGDGVAEAINLSINFPDASAGWHYVSASHDWLRSQNGTPDADSAGAVVSAANVVVLFINYITSGMATGEGVAPAPIPEGLQTGHGTAWFLSQGRIVKGTWSRARLTSAATYADAAGHPVALTPGRTWVELVPVGTVPTVSP